MDQSTNKPPISIFTATQGHASIATAIAKKLTNFHTYLHPYQGNQLDLYVLLYRLAPSQFKIIYNFSAQKPIQILYSLFNTLTYSKTIKKQISTHPPKLAISTYSPINPAIFHVLEPKNIPSINIIHNPYTIHPLEAYHHGPNLVFDQTGYHRLKQLGVPSSFIVKSGWFVQPQFEQSYDQNLIRDRLGFPKSQPLFLFQTGSEGTQSILNTLKKVQVSNTSQVIFACGNNKLLLKQISSLSSRLKRSKITLTPLPFTNDLHLYMQASDLVVGKAGPNTIFEAVATHTPFFATNHISGQEDGNLNLIRDYSLGYVQETPHLAAQKISQLLNNPDQLKQFKPHLQKLASYNKKSINILTQKIQELTI